MSRIISSIISVIAQQYCKLELRGMNTNRSKEFKYPRSSQLFISSMNFPRWLCDCSFWHIVDPQRKGFQSMEYNLNPAATIRPLSLLEIVCIEVEVKELRLMPVVVNEKQVRFCVTL